MKKTIIAFLLITMALLTFGCEPADPSGSVEAEEIVLKEKEVTLSAINETYAIEAEVKPANASDKTLHFQSMDAGVCDVNDQGVITARGNGEAIIKISCGKAAAEFKVKVSSQSGTVFTNVLKGCEERFYPTLTLYDDNTFELVENVYEGMTVMKGHYATNFLEYILTVEEQSFNNNPIEVQWPSISLMTMNEDYLQLITPMSMSGFGDVFSKDKTPVEFETYWYEVPGVAQEYWTTLHLYTDRSFELDENFMEGIEIVKGVYELTPSHQYIFNVMETTGRTGYDYGQISMQDSDVGLKILSDLYVLKKGEVFTAFERKISL